jgi:hypothetical protein
VAHATNAVTAASKKRLNAKAGRQPAQRRETLMDYECRTVSSVATMSTSAPGDISNQDIAIKFLTGLDDNRFKSSRRMSTTAELKHPRPWRQRPWHCVLSLQELPPSVHHQAYVSEGGLNWLT